MSAGQVTIRIWHGCAVRQVITVSDTGSSTIGAVGGAGNSTHADIELDPWANLVVDHRVTYPTPTSIRYEEPEHTGEQDESWDPEDIPKSIVNYVLTWPTDMDSRQMLAEVFRMYDAARRGQ
jgi:hypothetical protein